MSDLFSYLDDPEPRTPDSDTLDDVLTRARRVDVIDFDQTDEIEIIVAPSEPDRVPPAPHRSRRRWLAIAAAVVIVAGAAAVLPAILDDRGTGQVEATPDETVAVASTAPATPTTVAEVLIPENTDDTVAPTPTTIDTTRASDLSQVQVTTSLPQLYLAPGASAQVDWTIENAGSWWIDLGVGVCTYSIPPTASLCSSVAAPEPGTLNDGLAPGKLRRGTITITAPAEATPGEYPVTIAPLDGHAITATIYDPRDETPIEWTWSPDPLVIPSGGEAQLVLRGHNPRPWGIVIEENDCGLGGLEPKTGLPPGETFVCAAYSKLTSIAPGATYEMTRTVAARYGPQSPVPPGNYELPGRGLHIPVVVTG